MVVLCASFIFSTPCELLWCHYISAWLYFYLKFIFEVSSCPFELNGVSLEMLNSLMTHYTKLPTIITRFFFDFFDRKMDSDSGRCFKLVSLWRLSSVFVAKRGLNTSMEDDLCQDGSHNKSFRLCDT